MNLTMWRVRLRRVLFDLRWKFFGRGQSNYHCLTFRMPVAGDIPDHGPHVPLREILRRRHR
jgi:hypothetical protein